MSINSSYITKAKGLARQTNSICDMIVKNQALLKAHVNYAKHFDITIIAIADRIWVCLELL